MAATWDTNVLVAATPISSPARVYSTPSASRVAWLPMMLVTAMTLAPFSRASRMAARVSSVSPDWVMPMTRSRSSITGSRYRNSEATSISTGTRDHVSMA